MPELRDTLRSTFRTALRLANRRGRIRPGRLEPNVSFESTILGNTRQITVYLPDGYDQGDRPYPVLYMLDGQNLFDRQRSFAGETWRLHEAADAAIGDRTAAPLIVVGVDHAGPGRADEYTPTRDPKKDSGGRAADHLRMLVEELKPQIDARYRTLADSRSTAIGGSSLGGLFSLYAALTRPDVFSRAAAVSPSVWWDARAILRDVGAFMGATRPRLWVDIGGREGDEALTGARALRDALRARGWSPDEFRYHEQRRAEHNERAWAGRVRRVLEFLFPPAEF
jgi:predicted alpha/beta superfamily hydrolase